MIATASEIELVGLEEDLGLCALPPLDAKTFRDVRRELLLNGCKWDAQVGDISTLAPFPLIMKQEVWTCLASQAEQLAAECAQAEQEILGRPELLLRLGLPPALTRALASDAPPTPAAGRVIRFDFHPTDEGWRISEANADVPGGFTEASMFPALMAEHYADLTPAGNPAGAWCDALARTAGPDGTVALLSAPGYMEDHQVNTSLAALLRDRGCRTHLAKPEQIIWREGTAWLETSWHRGPVDALVRFYQSEWLAKLPRHCGWANFFRGGQTPVANPMAAVISESKRFPLIWDDLSTPMPAWRELLPETRDPRELREGNPADWIFKTAFCNTGDEVNMRHLLPSYRWWQVRWRARLQPQNWIAQRRFNSVPVPTPLGARHVCVGIYTVNGRAAGGYTRLAEKPLIDFTAVDVALLIES